MRNIIMNGEKDKFAPGNKEKESPLGKILATVIVGGITLFLCVSLFCKFGKLLIPTLVFLAGGLLLLTIWLKGLYIYRYLYPAIIIIGIFTVYPIFYTIFIAFTNYGTGHLLVKESAKEQLLNSKWFVYENDDPLYAEFFIPEEYVTNLNEKWKAGYTEYQKSLENAENESQEALVEDKWVGFVGEIGGNDHGFCIHEPGIDHLIQHRLGKLGGHFCAKVVDDQ